MEGPRLTIGRLFEPKTIRIITRKSSHLRRASYLYRPTGSRHRWARHPIVAHSDIPESPPACPPPPPGLVIQYQHTVVYQNLHHRINFRFHEPHHPLDSSSSISTEWCTKTFTITSTRASTNHFIRQTHHPVSAHSSPHHLLYRIISTPLSFPQSSIGFSIQAPYTLL
jgi:hypothetical protein